MTPAPQQAPKEQHICGTCDKPGCNQRDSRSECISGSWESHDTRSHPHPAPAFKRCCDSCINVPCKVLNRVPCLAQEKQENVCEENGCTDIENCDEICQHSRLFSPLQMQEAKDAAARQTLAGFAKELIAWLDQEIKEWPEEEVWYDSTLEKVKDHINESLRSTQHPGQEGQR